MRSFDHRPDDGFSLVEVLVVVIIMGVLAAIAIPRFLEHRTTSRDAVALNDIRNLATVATTIAAEDGVDKITAARVHGEGWGPSSEHIRACAAFPSDTTVTLTVWNTLGRSFYTWTQQTAAINGTVQPSQPDSCGDASAGSTLID